MIACKKRKKKDEDIEFDIFWIWFLFLLSNLKNHFKTWISYVLVFPFFYGCNESYKKRIDEDVKIDMFLFLFIYFLSIIYTSCVCVCVCDKDREISTNDTCYDCEPIYWGK